MKRKLFKSLVISILLLFCLTITAAAFDGGGFYESGSEEKSVEILKRAVKMGSSFAIGTRGEKGVILLYNDKIYYQEAENINPKDTLGAGDAFITGFLLELLKTKFCFSDSIIKKCLEIGVKNAAKYCKVYGAFGKGKKYNTYNGGINQ